MDGTGKFTRRRFYRGAQWMEQPSVFTVQPVDAQGRPTGRAIPLRIGSEDKRKSNDDFFIRRLRGIQWTRDCRSASDCTGASNFTEEALVEVRNARTGATPFTLSPDTRALRLDWSARNGAPYLIPVEQVLNPTWGYGFSIDIKALTPPRADGTYAPGSAVTFQMTLKDGAGKPLHPAGSLPTYAEFLFGQVDVRHRVLPGLLRAAADVLSSQASRAQLLGVLHRPCPPHPAHAQHRRAGVLPRAR